MSLVSWKEKHYPTPAEEIKDDRGAVEHAIVKWKGLTPAQLAKHGLKATTFAIVDEESGRRFAIDDSTCALCQVNDDCDTCPLQEIGHGCDDGRNTPYDAWKQNSDPKPMLKALRKAKATLTKLA